MRSPEKNASIRIAALLLCAGLFLMPRLWGLGRNWTADEKHWLERSYHFCAELEKGDYEDTVRSVHPGVVTMWTLAITQKLMGYRAPDSDGPKASPDDVGENELRIMKGGLIVVCLLLFVLIYFLLRRLVGFEAAIMACIFIGLDPLLAGYTRTLHLDGIYVLCGLASMLAGLIYYLGESTGSEYPDASNLSGTRRRAAIRWAAVSGILAGLATLNRSQGVIFVLLFSGFGIVAVVREGMTGRASWKISSLEFFKAFLLFSCCWAVTIFALFPALWTAPVESIEEILSGGVELVSRRHRHPLYFMGRRFYDAPGYIGRQLLYWFIFCFRIPPPVIIALGCGCAFLVLRFRSLYRDRPARKTFIIVTVVSIIAYISLISISTKTTSDGRYILLAFPLASIAAGIFVVDASRALAKRSGRLCHPLALPLVFAFVSIVNSALAMPYPLAYASPLIGGLRGYHRISSYGWGEGFYEVALWLRKHGRQESTVAVNYRGLEPYHRGPIIPLKDIKDRVAEKADVVALYSSPVFRDMPRGIDKIKSVLDRAGYEKHVIRIGGAVYFTIYDVEGGRD